MSYSTKKNSFDKQREEFVETWEFQLDRIRFFEENRDKIINQSKIKILNIYFRLCGRLNE